MPGCLHVGSAGCGRGCPYTCAACLHAKAPPLLITALLGLHTACVRRTAGQERPQAPARACSAGTARIPVLALSRDAPARTLLTLADSSAHGRCDARPGTGRVCMKSRHATQRAAAHVTASTRQLEPGDCAKTGLTCCGITEQRRLRHRAVGRLQPNFGVTSPVDISASNRARRTSCLQFNRHCLPDGHCVAPHLEQDITMTNALGHR